MSLLINSKLKIRALTSMSKAWPNLEGTHRMVHHSSTGCCRISSVRGKNSQGKKNVPKVAHSGRMFSFSGGSTILKQQSANSTNNGSCMYFFMRELLSSAWSIVSSSCLRCGFRSKPLSSSDSPLKEKKKRNSTNLEVTNAVETTLTLQINFQRHGERPGIRHVSP